MMNEKVDTNLELIEKKNLERLLQNDNSLVLVKEENTIRVVSYNILTSLSYILNENNISENIHLSWTFRKALVFAIIEQLDADFLSLQEVSTEQIKFLEEHLPQYLMMGFAAYTGHSLAEIELDENVGEILPILYDKNKFECLDSKRYFLSQTPHHLSIGWDASRPRIISCGVFRNRINGKKIVVANTHYDHHGSESLVKSGIIEAQILEQYRAEHNASDVIYTGDRNCFTRGDGRGNEWYTLFKKESGAKDTRDCGNHVGLETTFLGFHPDKFNAKYDCESGKFEQVTLDLIFHKGTELNVIASGCTSGEYELKKEGTPRLLGFFNGIKNPTERLFASDHCCVFADFKWF